MKLMLTSKVRKYLSYETVSHHIDLIEQNNWFCLILKYILYCVLTLVVQHHINVILHRI